jgi:hypothetical protein
MPTDKVSKDMLSVCLYASWRAGRLGNLANPVRRGTFGKVPLDGNSLGVHPTHARGVLLT